MTTLHILDCAAGNTRSLVNAVEKLNWKVKWVQSPADLQVAERLLFPGVGHFGHVMNILEKGGYVNPLKAYLCSGRPFMGICVGLQALFEESEEAPGIKGLGFCRGRVSRFDHSEKSVPHMGWNSAISRNGKSIYGLDLNRKYYYTHSYRVSSKESDWPGWEIATGNYGSEEFIGAIAKDNIFATQFHPEKSGDAGLEILNAFLNGSFYTPQTNIQLSIPSGLTNRIIACLDVRSNDEGDLVVTKGDQYDVRSKESGNVRNLGEPIELAERYYACGADEICFLNITSFRNCPLTDQPMLKVLREVAKTVFVPMTVGGGIRDTVDPDGTKHSALEVVDLYFKSGAEKVSIGSDAVYAVERYLERGCFLDGSSTIEQISKAYGSQAVVVSIDPKRIYVSNPSITTHHTIKTAFPGPNGEEYVWYECTVSGGRESRDIDVNQLSTIVEKHGAGEILLNCMDKDGSNSGYDIELARDVKNAVKIPVIASSGAGKPEHFEEVFKESRVDAALAAGIFHHGVCGIMDVKKFLYDRGMLIRMA
ncbi:Imidazole glycerol phosphate synthase hisHF [Neolecta irregularis DAH-3]|uniref:Imidazole glycerol phosphate synthase hisHF n=1 Tax=Neolecta irregularis (strain DAH-3) TaxID=1198029 RepID=A0A1U7LLZ7_NEOID|nr:Imidazole glycerol phosphate synthase hisHF [Neolecta irregularis DAH-3]|eukprot:OLL23684.1 Imidazole glycerol phosphate synthase hisHF [Neolecta irregularis DAH-3]